VYYGCVVGLIYGLTAAIRHLRRYPYQLVAAGKAAELERRLARGLDPDRPVPVRPDKKKGRPANSISLLYYSVTSNQRACLDALLAYHADPNLAARNEHTTPLLAAVRLKRDGMPEALLSAGADPNLPDIFGNTPLIEAAAAGRLADCRLLLDHGARWDAATFKTGVTALIAAARQGQTAVARLLLERGADPNQASFAGGTPLMDAAYNDYTDICQVLLDAGADPEAQIATDKIAGTTALLQCALHNRLRAAEVLLQGGADPNARWGKNGAAALHICITDCHPRLAALLLRHGADARQPNGDGTPPLHLAVWRDWGDPAGTLSVIEALCNHGADPEQRDGAGRTALHDCLWGKPDQPAQLREKVRLLLRHGADANAVIRDPSGRTPELSPLIMAATWGDVETLALLLDAGADAGYFPPADGGGYGRSALDMAVQEGQTEAVRLLLAHGVPFNPVGGQDSPALLYCIDNGHPEIARLLLAAGASPSAVAHSGAQGELHFPAVGLAALRDNPGLIGLLREFGASLDERTNWGATLLHLAAHNDAAASIEYLLAQGVDIEAPDDDGLRPLHEAAKTGSARAVELLLQHGAEPNSRATYGRQPLDLLGYNAGNIDQPVYRRIEQALVKAGATLSASYT
jgi:ankyrin repeat protein